jgi:WD40 repeat protein/DNA-binding SARP family transcriptional activator
VLSVRLLGGFEVELNGARADIPSRAAQALLAYLLLPPGKAHRRELLAGLLWPDVSEPKAQKSLRQALWQLGRALEPGGIRLVAADRVNVWVDVRGLDRLDVAELQEPLPPDAPAEALAARVAVYAGELLPGFYDEWVVVERERLEAHFERLMTRLLRQLEVEARWPEALEWGQRWIGQGHVSEAAYQTVMRAYAALGQGAGASLTYQRCREALRERLGLEPSEPTRALYNQIVQAFGMVAPAPNGKPETAAPAGEDRSPEPGPQTPPYKGLHYFTEADAPLFFGRERLVGQLVDYLRGHHFVAVVGASGSGKSSLVRAGLVPALRALAAAGPASPSSSVRILTPGRSPLHSLASVLAGEEATPAAAAAVREELAGDPGALRRLMAEGTSGLLVVDQFEELFTLCRDEAERRAFIANLLALPAAAAGENGAARPPQRVVITLRADFYAHCASYSELRQALESQQFYIGPMSASELRRAIELPAQRAGLEFQSGLVDLILRDVGDEPGALPLLSHALLETWRRRRGRQLALAGYAGAGGVHGAIARSAEQVYQDLRPEHQALARRIFLRLTELGEGTEATRRRAALSELLAYAGPVEVVLQRLAEARLIIIGEEAAEVAHEALIRAWPTLQQWLAEDRDGLRLHRRLTEAAQSWAGLEHDPEELYRGARLAQAREWAQAQPEALNTLEHEFLSVSEAQAEQETAEREAQRQRELETARQLAEAQKLRAEQSARSARLLRMTVAGLLTFLVVATVLAVVGYRLAVQRQALVEVSQANLARSEAQRLAAEADALLQSGGDAQLIALLAIRSLKIGYSPEADAVLGKAMMLNYPTVSFTGHTNSLRDAAYSPDSRLIVTSGNDNTARLWQADTGQELRVFEGHSAPVASVAYSHNGRYILTGSEDGTACLWDAGTGAVVLRIAGHTGQVLSVALSADDEWIVTSATDGWVRVWSAKTGQAAGTPLQADTETVAISPDGNLVLTGDRDGLAELWDWRSGQVVRRLEGHTGRLIAVTFSPDGKLAATASVDKTVALWDVATGARRNVLVGHTAGVFGVEFSPDGRQLVSVGEDRIVRLWDTTTAEQVGQFYSHSSTVTDVAFAPDGQHFVTAGSEGVALVWPARLPGPIRRLAGHTGQIWNVVYSPDGRYLLTTGVDKSARLWDTTTGTTVRVFLGHTAEIYGLAYAADGQLVMTGSFDGTARVWVVTTGQERWRFHAAGDAVVAGVALSPDGRYAAAADENGVAYLWDLATGAPVRQWKAHASGINLMSYSPDGTVLATTSNDATVKLWSAPAGALLHTLEGHTAFVVTAMFSPDGKQVVSASADRTVRIWDVATGASVRTITGHSDLVWSAVFSPDGHFLATASADGTARLWDAVTGQEVRRFAGHTAGVEAVAVAPDGQTVATGSDDGTARLWDIDYTDSVHTLCARLLRDLTAEEREQHGIGAEGATCTD